MAGIVRLNGLSQLKNQLRVANFIRGISTSPKNRETATITQQTATKTETKQENKNWVSFGFSTTNEQEDRNYTKSTFFVSVTLCLVWGGFVWAYLPDNQLRDWSQREAFLELRRREAAGLDPICRDFVDPANIELPSDEELGDTDIII